MAWLEVTAGDTRPSRVQLTANKRALPLVSTDVTLTMIPARGLTGTDLRRTCIIVDVTRGIIDIPWQTGDLHEGVSLAKFEVVDAYGLYHVPSGEEWLDVLVGPGGVLGPDSPSDNTVQQLVAAETAARIAADAALTARIAVLEALLLP